MDNKVETNFDHYKYEIIAMMLPTSAIRCAFIKKNVLKSVDCSPITCKECSKKFEEWLKQPYEEPVIEIDWCKVPIDTPVYVSNFHENPNASEYRRYFKEINEEGKFVCYNNGKTSFTTNDWDIVNWKYCTLARPEDVEKYKK